jgi:hypothetical protein
MIRGFFQNDFKKFHDTVEVKKAFKLIADQKVFKFYKSIKNNSSSKENVLNEYSLNDIVNAENKETIRNFVFLVNKEDNTQKYI